MKTRLRKAECPSCGYIVRLSRQCIAQGLPECPCGQRLQCPDPQDAMLVPPQLVKLAAKGDPLERIAAALERIAPV